MDYDLARRLFAEYKHVGQHYMDDFYPLLDYSLDLNAWMAWQYDNPESGKGMVQAFRRAENEETSKTLQLRGLDPDANYEIKNFDLDEPIQLSGRDLIEKGLVVEIKKAPGAALIAYKRL
jgi:alpha-galactosidase